jgi:hypothetical protein
LAATLLSKVGHVLRRCLGAAWLPVDPAGARTGQIRPACASATRDFATATGQRIYLTWISGFSRMPTQGINLLHLQREARMH